MGEANEKRDTDSFLCPGDAATVYETFMEQRVFLNLELAMEFRSRNDYRHGLGRSSDANAT